MLNSKKALQTHILVLIIISFGVAFFLSNVIDYIYLPDPQVCEYYNFKVIPRCASEDVVEFSVKNTEENVLNLIINGNEESVNPTSSKDIKLETTKSTLEIEVEVLVGEDYMMCNDKKQEIDIGEFRKC